jgi:hypothetical protein
LKNIENLFLSLAVEAEIQNVQNIEELFNPSKRFETKKTHLNEGNNFYLLLCNLNLLVKTNNVRHFRLTYTLAKTALS